MPSVKLSKATGVRQESASRVSRWPSSEQASSLDSPGKGGPPQREEILVEGENIANGLVARLANAGNFEISHVAGQRASQWISTTKSETIAIESFGQNGVVRIDLSKVTSPVSDVSAGFSGKPGMISNWAIKYQEVLIKNSVPANAIEQIK
jgi:hypothetical protein